MLVRVYTCQNATLLEITCHSSNIILSERKVYKATPNNLACYSRRKLILNFFDGVHCVRYSQIKI